MVTAQLAVCLPSVQLLSPHHTGACGKTQVRFWSPLCSTSPPTASPHPQDYTWLAPKASWPRGLTLLPSPASLPSPAVPLPRLIFAALSYLPCLSLEQAPLSLAFRAAGSSLPGVAPCPAPLLDEKFHQTRPQVPTAQCCGPSPTSGTLDVLSDDRQILESTLGFQ